MGASPAVSTRSVLGRMRSSTPDGTSTVLLLMERLNASLGQTREIARPTRLLAAMVTQPASAHCPEAPCNWFVSSFSPGAAQAAEIAETGEVSARCKLDLSPRTAAIFINESTLRA